MGVFSMLFGLFIFIPFFAVSVRSLHDTELDPFDSSNSHNRRNLVISYFAAEGTRGTNM
jgi:hypothetical protein